MQYDVVVVQLNRICQEAVILGVKRRESRKYPGKAEVAAPSTLLDTRRTAPSMTTRGGN